MDEVEDQVRRWLADPRERERVRAAAARIATPHAADEIASRVLERAARTLARTA
jgi:UDP-N-acetylglucosamine:LPS N-acetylglucosamine transferase